MRYRMEMVACCGSESTSEGCKREALGCWDDRRGNVLPNALLLWEDLGAVYRPNRGRSWLLTPIRLAHCSYHILS